VHPLGVVERGGDGGSVKSASQIRAKRHSKFGKRRPAATDRLNAALQLVRPAAIALRNSVIDQLLRGTSLGGDMAE
jgi:hypothetical protein